ncbi:lactoperoxidase-like, partial [Limulus polyphemus]|uniref:Lactoperoxidase-like n=1 Tax=Limulus polyphemus TaxID=6850 RepID=A0ABM1S828_LIMPO
PRVHINLDTSPLDANFMYGSTEELGHKLRLWRGGLMRVWDRFSEYGLKPLLPPMSDNPERDCISRPRHLFCFLAGDERVNEQIHLTVLHTLYVRDHNRLAIELGRLNPHWDDERIYHEVRHIMAASVQHITFNEFIPMTIGEEMVHRYNLTLHSQPSQYNFLIWILMETRRPKNNRKFDLEKLVMTLLTPNRLPTGGSPSLEHRTIVHIWDRHDCDCTTADGPSKLVPANTDMVRYPENWIEIEDKEKWVSSF